MIQKLTEVLLGTPSRAKDTQLYLYGVVPSEQLPAHESYRGISHQGLTAVVREETERDLASLSQQRLGRYLLKHQQVIEQVMQHQPILPFKLGTYLEDEASLHQLLEAIATHHLSLFEQARAQVEINLVAVWQDMAERLQQIARDPEVEAFKQQLNAKGLASLKERIQLGKLVAARLKASSQEFANHLCEALAPHHRGRSDHPLLKEEMILNAAFLVPRAQLAAFEQAVEALDARHGASVKFRQVGPLPLYSFLSLQYEEVPFEDIEEARELLGLAEAFQKTDIPRAFRLAVQQLNRETRDEPEAYQDGLADLKEARRMLLAYFANGGPARQPGQDLLLVSPVKLDHHGITTIE